MFSNAYKQVLRMYQKKKKNLAETFRDGIRVLARKTLIAGEKTGLASLRGGCEKM